MMRDLPIFLVVYVLFFLAFTHLHFIVSNTLHAGTEARGVGPAPVGLR